MMHAYADTLKNRAETALIDNRFDFIAKYHAVADLRQLAKKHPGVLDRQTIYALEQLLQSNAFRKMRQAYILFREAASVMTDMATEPGNDGLGSTALASLSRLLLQTDGGAHRGVAEALGSLPVGVAGPRLANGSCSTRPTTTWTNLLSASGLTTIGTPWFIGRSLVANITGKGRLLVVKLAKGGDTAAGLAKEIHWMQTLKQPDYSVGCRFHIPTPVCVENQPVFRMMRLPLAPPETLKRHPDGLAIAFVAHRDYFVYPNGHRIDGHTAQEILGRNAYLLGWLAAKGVIHDAPIALFHNRTQRWRRSDQGRYQWFRSGRLDQWLDSCEFPNLGLSGLRDFEHLASFSGDSRSLYRHIGGHFLSLLLVTGSHFRCRDKTKLGLDENGQPVDARDLFDRQLLRSMILRIFNNYYYGFTGNVATGLLPVNLTLLIDRMIEEMGVDRHMTELLRRADQRHMNDVDLSNFLKQRGYDDDQIKGVVRQEKDILIHSGPHLGGFNRQISLPELITCVAAMSALCIAGRYLNSLKCLPNPSLTRSAGRIKHRA